MSVFFTSDTHFHHKNVIEYCNRPVPGIRWMTVPEQMDAMNRILIEKWNDKVKPNDEVYHLGDMAFCGVSKFLPIVEKLNGKKFWIRGNHDYGLSKKEEVVKHFEWIRDYYVLRVQDTYADEEEIIHQYHQPIVLCHFPILSWDNMSHGSWHLHGHCHGSLPETKMMRLDVGVDTNQLNPYSYEEIKKIMIRQSVVPVDHHGL